MNVLQRKMFAQGDEVTPSFSIVSPGRKMSRQEQTGFGFGMGGGRDPLFGATLSANKTDFMDIVEDETGTYFGKEGDRVIPIDMAYGKTPREALKNMERAKGVDTLVNQSLTIGSLIALKRPIGKIGSSIGSKLYAPTTGAVGSLGPKIPGAYELTGLGKGAVGAAGLSGAYAAGSTLKGSAREGYKTDVLDDVDGELKEITTTPDQIAQDNLVVSSVVNTKEEDIEEKAEIEELINQPTITQEERQSSFFNNPNFIRLLRNLSAGLATAPDMASGFATGSAAAANERYEEEAAMKAAESEREFELEKAKISSSSKVQQELLKAEIAKYKDFSTNQNDYEKALGDAVFEYETSDGVIAAIQEAQKLVATGDVTGLSPLFKEKFRQAKAFFPGQDPELTIREVAKNIINDIINGNIKQLTGESGRTISNLDRQVAANLIGSINWSADQKTVMQKLNLALDRANRKRDSSYRSYQAASKPYTTVGREIPSNYNLDFQPATTAGGERIKIKMVIRNG